MRYQGVNRVYRIDEGKTTFFYVAPEPAAAVKCHHPSVHGKQRKRLSTKPVEVPADKILQVSFDDIAEAIACITGANPELIRPSLQGIPLADEFIAVHRAAEQWARMTPVGQSQLLRVL